ncbi:MAG: AMP-binding protein [Magnetococcales bacterium]|nr:AMP-binding protein [Magnetococcales bacterium]
MWHDFMRDHARQRPNHTALIDHATGLRWSYATLDREIDRRAGQLHIRGVAPGDRVALIAPNRLEHLTLFFACCRLRAILVPLNPRLALPELQSILRQIDPALLLSAGASPFGAEYPWGDLDAVWAEEGPYPPGPPPEDNEVMMLLYTSGSTGAPKGVMFHAAMIRANMAGTVGADVLRPGDISIVNTPFFHTGGYHVFSLPLLSIGGTLILHPRFDAGQVLADIRQEGVTVFWGVPTLFQAIFDHADFAACDFSRIRFFLSGGAPLPLALIQGYHRRGVPFKQGFGLTEVGPNCFLLETEEAFRRPDSIGKPMAHSRVRVMDERGEPVAAGGVGELWIGGAHRCRGYWGQEALFRESLRGDLFATGDLVRVDEEGYFYVVGRKKEMYISGGQNVYPGEVEKPLSSHPGIGQVVVVGVEDGRWGETGLAFYVGEAVLGVEEVQAFLESRLARYKHPRHVVRLEGMPLLANGKIDRALLKRRAKAYVAG